METMAAFCRLLAVILTFTSYLVSVQSMKFAQEKVRTPGSSVTCWTQEMHVDGVLRQVLWKHGADMLLWWDGRTPEYYGYYGNATKDRFVLNVTDGSLTILALTHGDSGSYTVELNGREMVKFPLRVISPVSVPRVSDVCRPEGDTRVFCLLTCEGDTAGSGPLRYRWLHAHGNITARTKTINTTVSVGVSSVGGFRCTVENDVSIETSVADPPRHQQPPPENVKTGDVHHGWKTATVILAVFCLVLLVSLVLFIVSDHRRNTGAWSPDIELSPQSNGEHSLLNGGPHSPGGGGHQEETLSPEHSRLNGSPHVSGEPGA